MPICFADPGTVYEITRLGGSSETRQHLADLGFHSGSQVTVVSKSGDDLIVHVKGGRIALGRNLSNKVYV